MPGACFPGISGIPLGPLRTERADLWSPEAPLFVDNDGAGLSDKRFHKAVRSIAEAAGLPGGGSYMSHSGRIGGASAAEAAGVSRAQVMLAGGWRSDPAKRGYVHQAVSARVELQRAMASGKAAEGGLLEPSRARIRQGRDSNLAVIEPSTPVQQIHGGGWALRGALGGRNG